VQTQKLTNNRFNQHNTSRLHSRRKRAWGKKLGKKLGKWGNWLLRFVPESVEKPTQCLGNLHGKRHELVPKKINV